MRTTGGSPVPGLSRAFRLLACAAMLAAAGCERPRLRESADAFVDQRGPGSAVGEIEPLAWRDSVGNPDRPVYPPDAVRLAPLWRFRAPEWEAPGALAVSPERVFVLDAPARAIYSVWRAGTAGPRVDRYVGLHGPTSIAWSKGVVAVADSSFQEILLIDASGSGAGALQTTGDPVVVATGGSFAVNGAGGRTPDWMVRDEKDYRSYIHLPTSATDGAGAPCSRVSGGRWFLQSSCTRPFFRVIGADGRVLRRISIDRAAAGEERRESSAIVHQESDVSTAVTVVPSPPRPVRGVRYDERERRFALWSEVAGGRGTQLDVFSGEGVYLARVLVPAAWRDCAFDGGMLFALETVDAGPARLSAYTLRLPGDSPVPAPPAEAP